MPRVEVRPGKTGESYRVIYYVGGERNTYSTRVRAEADQFAALFEKAGPDHALRLRPQASRNTTRLA